jgi:hypothetical protein
MRSPFKAYKILLSSGWKWYTSWVHTPYVAAFVGGLGLSTPYCGFYYQGGFAIVLLVWVVSVTASLWFFMGAHLFEATVYARDVGYLSYHCGVWTIGMTGCYGFDFLLYGQQVTFITFFFFCLVKTWDTQKYYIIVSPYPVGMPVIEASLWERLLNSFSRYAYVADKGSFFLIMIHPFTWLAFWTGNCFQLPLPLLGITWHLWLALSIVTQDAQLVAFANKRGLSFCMLPTAASLAMVFTVYAVMHVQIDSYIFHKYVDDLLYCMSLPYLECLTCKSNARWGMELLLLPEKPLVARSYQWLCDVYSRWV